MLAKNNASADSSFAGYRANSEAETNRYEEAETSSRTREVDCVTGNIAWSRALFDFVFSPFAQYIFFLKDRRYGKWNLSVTKL